MNKFEECFEAGFPIVAFILVGLAGLMVISMVGWEIVLFYILGICGFFGLSIIVGYVLLPKKNVVLKKKHAKA